MQNFQNMFFNPEAMNMNDVWQKNYDTLVKVNQINAENNQAILKRVGEIIQKQITDAVEATKDILSSQNPDQTASKQNNYLQSSTKNAMTDSKEVAEMVSKANMELYDMFVKRAKENLNQSMKKPAKV